MNDTYKIVKDFIPVDRSLHLSEKFKNYCKRKMVDGDPQVPNAPAVYNYLYFLELLCEKTLQLSEVYGEPLFPTYSYARVYGNGDSLFAHTDRESCDVSVTVNLDCDLVWPIYIHNKDGDTIECLLGPGDAMVYKGKEALHWRDEFLGEECVQVFLHYVRSRGPYKNEYFDKQRLTEQVKCGFIGLQDLDEDV